MGLHHAAARGDGFAWGLFGFKARHGFIHLGAALCLAYPATRFPDGGLIAGDEEALHGFVGGEMKATYAKGFNAPLDKPAVDCRAFALGKQGMGQSGNK